VTTVPNMQNVQFSLCDRLEKPQLVTRRNTRASEEGNHVIIASVSFRLYSVEKKKKCAANKQVYFCKVKFYVERFCKKRKFQLIFRLY
jgi:predicted AlkP superfamily phosphohydrolase/phosphomutase